MTKERRPPQFQAALSIKEDDAIYEHTNPVRLYRRVSGSLQKGKIAYFLAGDQLRLVLVTPKGWKIGTSNVETIMISGRASGMTRPRYWERFLERL